MVHHDERRCLEIRLEIVRELGRMGEVANHPTKGMREFCKRRDLGAGAKEKKPHRKGNDVNEGAGAFRHQFSGREKRGAKGVPFITGSEATQLTTIERIAEFD